METEETDRFNYVHEMSDPGLRRNTMEWEFGEPYW